MIATAEVIIKVNDEIVFQEEVKIENTNKRVVCASILTACEETSKMMKEKLTDKFELME